MSTFFLSKGEKIHLGVKSDHEWRKQKRRELDAVLKAADIYLRGSAYTPAPALTNPGRPTNLLYLLRDMRSKLTVKGWGR